MKSGRRPTLDEQQIEKIKIALRAGAAVRDLAKRFDVSSMTLVRAGLTAHKIAPKKRARKKKGPSPFARRWNYRT
jgi:hypothetical protein